MCLFGLAGLGLEAIDKFLQVGNLVLLLGKCVLLQLHLLGAHVFELAVVAAVAHQLGCVDMQGDIGDRVQKFPVVADDDHGAFVLLEPGFQPHQRVQIQVVGGLVQQQQIGGAHQGPRQLQAHAPAAREAVDWVGQLGGFETQSQDQGLRACGGVVCAGVLQRHVGMGHTVVVFGGLGRCDFLLRGQQGGVAVDHKVGGRLVGLWHVLRDLAHAPLGRDVVFARVFVQ